VKLTSLNEKKMFGFAEIRQFAGGRVVDPLISAKLIFFFLSLSSFFSFLSLCVQLKLKNCFVICAGAKKKGGGEMSDFIF